VNLDQIETQTSEGTYTILFTDLEGSTDLRVKVGDARANELINAHDELIRTELAKSGIVETKSLGDGFMALFTSANKAIDTAVAIQKAIDEHNQAHPDLRMSVRMGLNTGDVTHSPGDAHGTAVHAAARIAAKAQGGQILISQVVNDIAGSHTGTKIADRGLFWLKGFPERWRLFEVLWRSGEDRETGRATREVKAASASAFDLSAPRAVNAMVGRVAEQSMIRERLEAASSAGLQAVVVEGEAGIGKTRLLEAAADLASDPDHPFWVLEATADEELSGPFLLFRSLLTSPRTAAIAREAMALEQLDRAQEAISGRSPRAEGLSPQEQVLRTFDEVTSAILALTRERPIALLLDDLQWADEDSIQLIRYLVRTLASGPIFLLIAIRPYSDSASGGAGKLIADLDRMRVTNVIRLQRLTRIETGTLLASLLGAPVDDQTLNSLHARSEGVPFFIEELTRAYREAEALQLIDGTWTMTRLSGPAVPSSIQSLIERRLAQLPDECRALLADAGLLGRKFRLADLSRVLATLTGEPPKPDWQLGEDLTKAVDLGLIVEQPEGSSYDFSFSHDQIRASLVDSASRQRQRAIHGAITEILAAEGGTENLSMLAYHALKAGDGAVAVSSALKAARAAMDVSAPEEAIRLIDTALPAASAPEDRIEMLRMKDDALSVLDRGMERHANLAEMAALTTSLGDPAVETEVRLRRASAARATEDYETAADLAIAVCEGAVDTGDRALELAACLELGQARAKAPIGEAYYPADGVEQEAAEAAYERALGIARELGDRSGEAAALRELAVLEIGRVNAAASAAVEGGSSRIQVLFQAPAMFTKAKELADEAFRIFEELGDKRGAMSALISMAYAHIADPTATGMAGRLEHIRTLYHSRKGEVTESQRAVDDALMLYSIHTFARQNLQPGLALERGREAFEAARALGDRWLESLAAGGMALTFLSIGDATKSTAWLERSATAAMAVASSAMARRLEMWRGAQAAAEDDLQGTVAHFRRAAELAGQKHLGGRCEALSTLAFEAARIAVATGDRSGFEIAGESAREVLEAVSPISGTMPWAADAHAALALIAEAEGDADTAAEHSRAALDLDGETFLVQYLHVLWVGARTLIAGEEPEAEGLRNQILEGFAFVNMVLGDPETKKGWFAIPMHREIAEIVGFDPSEGWEWPTGQIQLSEPDLDLLRELASGSAAASEAEAEVDELLAKLGVASPTEAIEFAIRSGVTWQ
jgi:class 3 adenylate cyclase/tetratricopeptide (TPR) repeat protein